MTYCSFKTFTNNRIAFDNTISSAIVPVKREARENPYMKGNKRSI